MEPRKQGWCLIYSNLQFNISISFLRTFKVLSLMSLALENKCFENMLHFLHLPLLAVIIFFNIDAH